MSYETLFALGSDPALCGILNVTPDSFSDGGRYDTVATALAHARELQADGAKLLDLGAESTRPGSDPVDAKGELARLLPVIQAIREDAKLSDMPLSIDTFKAETAEGALDAGANIVNDITGLFGDPEMARVIARHDAGLILMYNPLILRPWHPASQNFRTFAPEDSFTNDEIEHAKNLTVTEQMLFFFDKALRIAREAGISDKKIWLDPGIGFGLTRGENLALLDSHRKIHNLGYPAFFGVSRKRFLKSILEANGMTADLEAMDRATAAISMELAQNGVELLRVHNVAASRPAVHVGTAILRSKEGNLADTVLGRYTNG